MVNMESTQRTSNWLVCS